MRFAKRLDAVPPYLFSELEGKKEQKRREGVDVISLGIGDPDLHAASRGRRARPTPRGTRCTHQYPTNHGSDELREAAAAFSASASASSSTRRRRSCPALGGKEGGRPHSHGTAGPGRRLLSSPDPGYPPYTSAVHYLPAPRCTTCRCAPSRASCPTSRRSRPTCSRARTCSSSTTRTTRPARSSRPVTRAGGRACARKRSGRRPRQRVLGALLRRLPRAELPRDAGRKGGRRRDLLALEGLEHDGLARRPRRRQPGGGRALPAAEDEPRLGHVRGGSARDRGRAHRARDFPREMSAFYERRRDLLARRCPRSGSRSTRRRRRRLLGARA